MVASAIELGVRNFRFVPGVVITNFSFDFLVVQQTVLPLRGFRLQGQAIFIGITLKVIIFKSISEKDLVMTIQS